MLNIIHLFLQTSKIQLIFTETSPVGGGEGGNDESSEDRERSANTDNKHNLAQREQYYATIRKAAPRDQQSDLIPGE